MNQEAADDATSRCRNKTRVKEPKIALAYIIHTYTHILKLLFCIVEAGKEEKHYDGEIERWR